MNWFSKLWKKNTKTPLSNDDTYIDIAISLNKNKQISFAISLDDKLENKKMNIVDYSMLCAEFFDTVVSSMMKEDTINILNQQIKTSNNETLINNIVSIIKIMDKNNKETKKNFEFIKPSEVFIKHNI